MTEVPTVPFTLSALHDNGSTFHALIEHSADLITLLGRHGQVLYQSPSARQHLGCDRDHSPLHHHIMDDLHPEDRERVVRQVCCSVPGETLTLCPYRVHHANGSWRWLKGTAVNLLDDPKVRGILVQSRDVTAEVRAGQRARALEGLSMALASTSTTDEVVQVMLLQGLEAMGALAGGVLLLDEAGTLVNVLGSAGYPARIERPWRRFALDTPVPAADAIREDRDVFLTREDWQVLYPHLPHAHAPGSNAALPLKSNGKVMGAITLSFQEDRVPSETERQHLRSVAAQCALALERSELHARLQTRERLYRKLAAYSSDPVAIISLTGTTQYVSPSVERMLGYTPQERIGLNVFEGIHPDDRDRVNRAFREAVDSRLPCLVTYRFQHKAGHWVWLESTGTNAVHDTDLRGVVINTRDVTARIEGEQARQASERRLQLVGEQSDTLIHIYNPDQECIYISPAAQSLLGYSPEELQACSVQIHHLVHPEDLPGVEAAWKAQAQASTPAYRMRGRDGTFRWVESTVRRVTDEQGVLVETHVATRDITSRKEAEQALRLQLRRFQHLVDLTAEFAAQEDAEQHIQTALERCLNLTPYTYGFYFPVNGDTLIGSLHAGETAEQMLAWTLPLERIHRNGQVGKALRRHDVFFAGPEQTVFCPPEPLPRQVWTSLAVLPVVSRGVLRGCMVFRHEQQLRGRRRYPPAADQRE